MESIENNQRTLSPPPKRTATEKPKRSVRNHGDKTKKNGRPRKTLSSLPGWFLFITAGDFFGAYRQEPSTSGTSNGSPRLESSERMSEESGSSTCSRHIRNESSNSSTSYFIQEIEPNAFVRSLLSLPEELRNLIGLYLGYKDVARMSEVSHSFGKIWGDTMWIEFIYLMGGMLYDWPPERSPKEAFRYRLFCIDQDLEKVVGPYDVRFAEAMRRIRGTLPRESELRVSMLVIIERWLRDYESWDFDDRLVALKMLETLREVASPQELENVEETFRDSDEFARMVHQTSEETLHQLFEEELRESFRRFAKRRYTVYNTLYD